MLVAVSADCLQISQHNKSFGESSTQTCNKSIKNHCALYCTHGHPTGSMQIDMGEAGCRSTSARHKNTQLAMSGTSSAKTKHTNIFSLYLVPYLLERQSAG